MQVIGIHFWMIRRLNFSKKGTMTISTATRDIWEKKIALFLNLHGICFTSKYAPMEAKESQMCSVWINYFHVFFSPSVRWVGGGRLVGRWANKNLPLWYHLLQLLVFCLTCHFTARRKNGEKKSSSISPEGGKPMSFSPSVHECSFSWI